MPWLLLFVSEKVKVSDVHGVCYLWWLNLLVSFIRFGICCNILKLINPCCAGVMAEATFCTHKWCLYLAIKWQGFVVVNTAGVSFLYGYCLAWNWVLYLAFVDNCYSWPGQEVVHIRFIVKKTNTHHSSCGPILLVGI